MLNMAFYHIIPILSPVSACRHHIKISGGQTNSMKSLFRGNRGYLALKNGLRNQNWPQEGLFSAKILINTCSGRWRRHDVRHDLARPILFWKKWIVCQTKALTKSCKMRVLVTGLNTELGKNFSRQVHPCSRSAQLAEQECDTYQGVLKSIWVW